MTWRFSLHDTSNNHWYGPNPAVEPTIFWFVGDYINTQIYYINYIKLITLIIQIRTGARIWVTNGYSPLPCRKLQRGRHSRTCCPPEAEECLDLRCSG